jgi:hypothetical protein
VKIKGSLLITLLFLLIGLFGIVVSANFHYWESITLPLIVSSLIFMLAGVQLVLEFHPRAKHPITTAETSDEKWHKGQISRAYVIIVWIVALILAIYLLGFYLAAALFIFAYLKWHARGWTSSVIFAVTLVLFIYLIFNIGLKSPLYKGLLFSLW